MKKILTLSFAALMILADAIPLLTVAAVTTAVLAPVESQALPATAWLAGKARAMPVGRAITAGIPARRAVMSRARRRGIYGLPGGAVPYAYGGYRYYRVGGRFLYPYMYGGRTVYVDVDVNGGYPAPPPPAGPIDIDIEIDIDD